MDKVYDIKNIHSEGFLQIGDNVSQESFSSIICKYHIIIGQNTIIGPGAVIVDIDHYTGDDFKRTAEDGEKKLLSLVITAGLGLMRWY